jgi:2-keto-3-deoxy-L-rhamnonate aldolase RhmA
MKGSDLLADDRHVALGLWIKLPLTESVEAAHLAGFDFVVIDLEHSMIELGTAAAQIALARALDIAALVRIPLSAGSDFGRILDAGASGLVIPHVNSPEEAATAVQLARFPPVGERGAGPTSRAGDWGTGALDDYLSSGADTLVIVQVETEAAAGGIAQIAVPGVDAVLIGRLDLAVSMGEPSSSDRVSEVVESIEQQALKVKVPVGTAVAMAEHLNPRYGKYGFVVVSNDATLLVSSAKATVKGARAALKDETSMWV